MSSPKLRCTHAPDHHVDQAEADRCLADEIRAGNNRARVLGWMKRGWDDKATYRGAQIVVNAWGAGDARCADVLLSSTPVGRPDSKHTWHCVWEIRRSTAYKPTEPWALTVLPEDPDARGYVTAHASFEMALAAAISDAGAELSIAIELPPATRGADR